MSAKVKGITLTHNTDIKNLIPERLNVDPASPELGRIWFNVTEKKLKTTDTNGNIIVLGAGSEVDLSKISSDILPLTNGTINIGSPTQRFSTIYVNEAKLSTNTLYIGDTPILGTSADTINIHANPGQSISIKSTGDGTSTTLTSDSKVQLSTNGMNADVVLQASGVGSKVRIGAEQSVDFSSLVNFQSNATVSGDLTVSGNLITSGTVTSVNAVNLQVKDNLIDVNYGEVGDGVTTGTAGMRVMRGGLSSAQLVWDESDDKFKVGLSGTTLETIATREWVGTQSLGSSGTTNVTEQQVYGAQQVANFTVPGVQNVVVGNIIPFDFTGSIIDSGTSNKMKLIAGKSYQFNWTSRIDGSDNINGEWMRVQLYSETKNSTISTVINNDSTGDYALGVFQSYNITYIPTVDEVVLFKYYTESSASPAEISGISLQVVETSFTEPKAGLMQYGAWQLSADMTNVTSGAVLPIFGNKRKGSLNADSTTQFTCKAGVTYKVECMMGGTMSGNNGFGYVFKDVSTGTQLHSQANIATTTNTNNVAVAKDINEFFKFDVDTVISLYFIASVNATTINSYISYCNITEISTAEVSLANMKINGKQFDSNNNVDLEGYSTLSSPQLGVEVLTEERHFKTGKPIYKKTIDFGALPNATSKNINHNILNMEDYWVDMQDSYIVRTADSIRYTISLSNTWYPMISLTEIGFNTADNRTTHSAYVTVKYTKTTDTASSPVRLIGPSVTDYEMAPYSTAEQLTEKRWIDGKPIYQVALNFTLLGLNSWSQTDFSSFIPTNASNLIVSKFMVTVVKWDTIITESYQPGTGYCSVSISADRKLHTSTNNPDIVNNVGVVIIEYTKTTDTAQTPVRTLKITDNLPSVTSADEGKMLMVNANGQYDIGGTKARVAVLQRAADISIAASATIKITPDYTFQSSTPIGTIANNEITIAKTGLYVLTASIHTHSAAVPSGVRGEIYVNGASYWSNWSYSSATTVRNSVATIVRYCTAGDVISMYAKNLVATATTLYNARLDIIFLGEH